MYFAYGCFCVFIFFHLVTVYSNACSIFESFCKIDKEKLNCYGNDESTPPTQQLQPFREALQNYRSISKLYLKSLCVAANELDGFDSLKVLEIYDSTLKNEKVFTEKIGLTLTELNFEGNYSLSLSIFKSLKNLTTLSFIFNYQIEPLLTKEFFSESLSNLKTLELTHSRISRFDGDMFVNLKSLETLSIYINLLTDFPKAIKFIPSLKYLYVGANMIEVLKNLGTHPNLESINFSGSELLTHIESCAFCNFPKLKNVNFFESQSLTWIHENAFGSLLPEYYFPNWNKTKLKLENMEIFNIEDCNVSVLPEFLLDWKSMKRIELGGNRFHCNCSNAWLIEDIQHSVPAFADNFGRHIIGGHKSLLKCYGPEKFENWLLKDVSIEACKKGVCEIPSNISWFFAGIFIGIFIMNLFFVGIVFRQKLSEFYHNFQSHVEHIKLQDYTHS